MVDIFGGKPNTLFSSMSIRKFVKSCVTHMFEHVLTVNVVTLVVTP